MIFIKFICYKDMIFKKVKDVNREELSFYIILIYIKLIMSFYVYER